MQFEYEGHNIEVRSDGLFYITWSTPIPNDYGVNGFKSLEQSQKYVMFRGLMDKIPGYSELQLIPEDTLSHLRIFSVEIGLNRIVPPEDDVVIHVVHWPDCPIHQQNARFHTMTVLPSDCRCEFLPFYTTVVEDLSKRDRDLIKWLKGAQGYMVVDLPSE